MAILEAIHVPRRERKARLAEHIEELGLGQVAKQKAYTLSGGEGAASRSRGRS
jgi:lipopolysaccharide export system ATP-binding protein